MKTHTDNQLPVYQILGPDLRINFDECLRTRENMHGSNHSYYEYTTAIASPNSGRAQLIESIILAKYSYSEELSFVNNQFSKPEEYSAYQAFRNYAKQLADVYLATKEP